MHSQNPLNAIWNDVIWIITICVTRGEVVEKKKENPTTVCITNKKDM